MSHGAAPGSANQQVMEMRELFHNVKSLVLLIIRYRYLLVEDTVNFLLIKQCSCGLFKRN